MEIVKQIIEWLQDQKRYKKTFAALVTNYCSSDQIYAATIVKNIRVAGLLSEEYAIDETFVAYSKHRYSILVMAAVVDNNSE